MLTQAFAEALAEAEKIIAGAPHIACEQDLAEGYDYLAGSIQASLRLAWAYQRDFPYFVQSTGPYTKMGREDRAGWAPPPADTAAQAKRYAVAGKILLSRLRTFLAFPEWFYLKEPVNTMTPPRSTPGGLASQFSSAGHFDLAEDQAMIVTVPAAGRPPRPTRASSSAACGTSRWTTSTTRPASPPTRPASTRTASCAS